MHTDESPMEISMLFATQPCKVVTRLSQDHGMLCKAFTTLQYCDNLA